MYDYIFYELKVKLKGKACGRMYWYSDDNTTIYFEGLNVACRERRKGFGTKLLEILENNAICLGATISCLGVRKNSWMQEWYKRKGYVDFQDYENGDFVWMKKSLLANLTI